MKTSVAGVEGTKWGVVGAEIREAGSVMCRPVYHERSISDSGDLVLRSMV